MKLLNEITKLEKCEPDPYLTFCLVQHWSNIVLLECTNKMFLICYDT